MSYNKKASKLVSARERKRLCGCVQYFYAYFAAAHQSMLRQKSEREKREKVKNQGFHDEGRERKVFLLGFVFRSYLHELREREESERVVSVVGSEIKYLFI